jgi:hypothetical protein
MARSLPSSLVKGLNEIATLSSADFGELLARLRAIPTEIKQHRVFSGTDFEVGRLPDKGQSLKEAAFSLLLSRAGSRIPIAEFVEGLTDALHLDSDLLETLRSRVTDILSIDTLDLVARAHNVLLEHAQTFSSARVVSDIRPIFEDDVKLPPRAAVLVNMLSIEYFSAGIRHKFVVAMDDVDVRELLATLQRARDKSETLQHTMKHGDIPYIKVV